MTNLNDKNWWRILYSVSSGEWRNLSKKSEVLVRKAESPGRHFGIVIESGFSVLNRRQHLKYLS
jgi:hypothetical protein